MQEARFAGACQDQHAGRPAPSLGWPGERKSIGATNREKATEPRLQGLGPGQGLGPRAWGRGLQKLRARGLQGHGAQATRAACPNCHLPAFFRRSEKSPGRRKAKGWATGQVSTSVHAGTGSI